MLISYDFKKRKVANIEDAINPQITYLLSGENSLEFSLSISSQNLSYLKEEYYIQVKDNEYVIKSVEGNTDTKHFKAVINVEDLVGKSIKNIDMKNTNIGDILRTAISGTGWTVTVHNVTKRRTVSLTNTNALEVIREARKKFSVDYILNAKNKTIDVYEKFGEDRGAYLSDELNITSLNVPSDTYDYATRLYPYGKDGLSIKDINGGKEYIENFQYTNKVIELIWEDNRYTDKESLKEDGISKLDEISKPKRNYNVTLIDLAKFSTEYNFLDYFLGDTVTLISSKEKFRDTQRIVKYIEYLDNPTKNTCELGNTALTFEELQAENDAKNEIIDNITNDDKTINGDKVTELPAKNIKDLDIEVGKIVDFTAINADITNLKAQNVTITGELNTVKANIGEANINIGRIDQLVVTQTAQINDLKANSATITQLDAVSAKIGTVEADVGKINTLLAGNLTGENIQAGGITSDKLTIANGFITNAMIANLDVSKINAGDISTNKFKIKSDNGGIEIVGATQQFKDKNNKVRIQMGQDTQGNFNFIIRGEDGTTTLIDHTGIKEKAIADDLIISDMIASDAVGEKQINYSSFITGFNKDTNTNTIKSTKIMLNNQNQTLDVAFSQLKTQSDGIKSLTESHSTTIGVMQGQISTAINNTQIVKDGQTILLKDDYNRTVQTIDSMKSTIGSHTSQIDGLNSTVSTQGSSISQLKNQIALKVEQTDITTAINNMNIGGENIFLNANFAKRTTKTNIGWDNSKNGTTLANSWSCYNSEVENPSTGYHAHLYQKDGEWVARYVNESDKRWKSFTQSLSDYSKKQLVPGEKYTFSVDIYSENTGCYLHGGLHSYRKGDTNRAFNSGTYGLQPTVLNKWVRMSWTFTVHSDIDLSKDMAWYIYGYQGSVGTIYMKKPQLQRGTKATDFNISQEDNDNSIANVQTQITSTSNKVATIETNLNSITQRVSSTESTVSTHTTQLGTVDSRINTAKNSAISTASTDATSKANSALSDAKSYTNGQITTVNQTITNKVAEIKATTDSITQKVSSTESKVTTIQSQVNTANSNIDKNTELAKAMSLGKMLYTDPIFKNGSNSIRTYNNSGGSHLTVSRITKPSDLPTSSTHCIEIKVVGTTTSPGRGGFYFGNLSRANAIFITRFIAKIPTGYTVNFATNAIGSDYSGKWLTSNAGTGKWEEYIYKLKCGSSGNFSTTNYFYLNGGSDPTTSNPLIWYLAYATVSDITDMDYTVQDHTTQITNTNNKVATIETNLSSITSRVSSTETTLSSTTATANSALSKANSAQTTANSANSLANTANNTANANKSSISSLTTRVSTAESKLTKDSLTTTIGSYYTTSTDVNGIVTSKGYQTASQVQQTVNAFELKFQESGGYNLVYNSDFKNGDHLWSISSGAKYYFGTGNWNSPTGLGMAITGQSGTSLYAVQELTNTSYRQAKTFTLSGLVNISSTGTNDSTGAKFQLYVRVTYDDDTKKYHMCNIDESSLNKWQKVFVTFDLDTTKTVTDLRTTVSIQNTTKTIFVSQIMLEVGSMMSPWCPNSSEVYDGVTTIDKEGITVTASNVKSKTTISANGFKITKTDTNTDVFKVNSDGRLSLIGDYTAYNGNRKAGYFGMNEIKFYNWWSDTNEEIATIYGGKDSSNRRSANMVGRDTVALGVGTASSGSKVLESTSSKLSIYKDTDFGGGALTNVRKLNYDVTYDTWINRLYIRSNQINTNMSSGYLHLNYWKGGNTTSTSTHVKIGNGNNDDANGALTCGNFKATGTKNCIVQTTVGYIGINAYETAECYFGDVGTTILDNEGYSFVYIDNIFTETVNTNINYHVFLSVYGEGLARVVKRTSTYFIIKGTANIEVGYEIKAKRKGYEDYRLEREVNNWRIGENHGLDEEYQSERNDFDSSIEQAVQENIELNTNIQQDSLNDLINRTIKNATENKNLIESIEVNLIENTN